MRWLIVLVCLPLTLHAGEVWSSAGAPGAKVIRVFPDHVIARLDASKGRCILTAVSLRDGKELLKVTFDTYGAWWDGDSVTHAGGTIDLAKATHVPVAGAPEQPPQDPRMRHRHPRRHDPRHHQPQQWLGPDGLVSVEQGHVVFEKGGKWNADARVVLVRTFSGGAYVMLEQRVVCVATDGTASWSLDLERSRGRALFAVPGGAVIVDEEVRFVPLKTGKAKTIPLGKGRKLGKEPVRWFSDDHRWLLLDCPWSSSRRGKDGKTSFKFQSGMLLIDGEKGKSAKAPTHGLLGIGKTGMAGSRMVDDKTSHVGWRSLYEVVSLGSNKLVTMKLRPAGVGDEHWLVLSDAHKSFTLEVFRFPRKRLARIPIKNKAYARLIWQQIADSFQGKAMKGPDAFVNYGAWARGVWWQTHDLVWGAELLGKSKRKQLVAYKATSKQMIRWAVPTARGLLVAKGTTRGANKDMGWILLK